MRNTYRPPSSKNASFAAYLHPDKRVHLQSPQGFYLKIGFLGNTNNYPFRLARAMRELGHDVVFFVDRPRNEPRHRPEFHYPDIPYPYPEWIREIRPLSPPQILLRSLMLRDVIRTLESCEGVVLNGFALSLANWVHRPVIGILTGSDLDVFANPKLVDALAGAPHRSDRFVRGWLLRRLAYFCKRAIFARFVHLQRNGIARCRLLEYAIPGLLPDGDALLEDIGVSNSRRTSFMLTDIEHLPALRLRADEAFRVFCATRLQWKQSELGFNLSPLDNKGTDVMLDGLHVFAAGFHRPLEIHLIAFGKDTQAVADQVRNLGLETRVTWHPQLSQEDFLSEMAQADVVLENFGPDSCIGMAGRDAIAMGKPVVAWSKSALFEHELGEALPIYEARSADEICARLNEIIDNPEEAARHSARARAFASRWFSSRRAAERCIEAFEAMHESGSSSGTVP